MNECRMAAAGDDQIIEGFLCPICRQDLRSDSNLLNHFQEVHSEEQAILKSIKDLYGKAKKKILKLDESELESFKNEIKYEKYYLDVSEPQNAGQINSHTDYYKEIRRERLDHRTTETNKLIIRLDRLLRFEGADRKQQEQELVTWLDGATVTRCPSCAANFNITRRQHHCRLCGSIMCNSCSCFLSCEMAQTIVAPIGATPTHKETADSLRICKHCMEMLETRRKVQIEQMVQPLICQLYSQIQKIKVQIQNAVDLYNKMYNSLVAGETTFLLQDVQTMRTEIARKAEMLDTLSKKINLLPIDDQTPKMTTLQSSIRKATNVYIKDNLLTLPAPPTPEELERYKREQSIRFKQSVPLPPRATNVKKVVVTTGWSPMNVSVNESEDDLLVQQMNIVRNYIEQARGAKRFEEVACLQDNLNMLKEMYKERQKNNETDH